MLLHVFHPAPTEGIITLFPNEHGGGVFFSNTEINAITGRLAGVYVQLTAALGKALESEFALPSGCGEPIARRAVIPLTHCYTDRLLRLHRLLSQTRIDAIAAAPEYELPLHCEKFDYLATNSFAFNQDVVGRVGRLFGIPTNPVAARDPFENQAKMPAAYTNHLFFFAASNKLSRGWQRLQLAWSRRRGHVIATWMVNTKIPTLEAGLYGKGGFAHMEDAWSFDAPPQNVQLRQRLLHQVISGQAQVYQDLLADCGIGDPGLRERAVGGLADFFVNFLPPTLLEAAPANLATGIRELGHYPRCSAVYSCGLAQTTQAAFLIAASRATGKKVIGTQHGGHYGYMAAHTAGVDVEYPDCDEYVTWGWKQFPAHPALARPRIATLPAPWYSHRRLQWRTLLQESERVSASKEFDFAYMPNKVYPYVPAPSAAHASINHLTHVSELFKHVAGACTIDGRSMLMKLYGMDSQRLLADTLAGMQKAAGPLLRMNDNLDKGITPTLVKRCNMFLWDQPGTGFIECLHAGIPAIVYWPRLYNCEEAAAVPLFKDLEEAGLVHRSMRTLLDTYAAFKADPRSWMADPRRQSAGVHFVKTYGWAEDDWPKNWRDYLRRQVKP